MPPKPNYDASTATPNRASPDERFLERLPGPHLTRSSRAFSLIAHHDGLQPTQHQGGLAPAPAGPTLESQQASISRTAPPMDDVFYTTPPPAFVTHCFVRFAHLVGEWERQPGEFDWLLAGLAAAGPALEDRLQQQHGLRECQAGRG